MPTGRHRLSATVTQPRFDVREAEGQVLIRVESGSPVEVPPAEVGTAGGPTA
jgi:ferric-dicitrate binding protein FerR (iron transport regulator)